MLPVWLVPSPSLAARPSIEGAKTNAGRKLPRGKMDALDLSRSFRPVTEDSVLAAFCQSINHCYRQSGPDVRRLITFDPGSRRN